MQSSLTPSGLSPHVASLVAAFITNAERKFMASGRDAQCRAHNNEETA